MRKIKRFATHKSARGPVYIIELASHKKMQRMSRRSRPAGKRGDYALGLHQANMRTRKGLHKIWINDKLRGWQLAQVALHEMIHAEFPQWQEFAVKRLEASFMGILRRAWDWEGQLCAADEARKRKKR